MYITKNEAQSYADAAAVAAALKLDGTAAGLTAADAAVAASPNKWGFSTIAFGTSFSRCPVHIAKSCTWQARSR